MKKLLTLFIALSVMLFAISCSSESHEEKLLGKWQAEVGNKQIVYSFEKYGDVYKGGRMILVDGSLSISNIQQNFQQFDNFSATSDTITFTKDGSSITEDYYFEDGYLYMADIKFKKIE